MITKPGCKEEGKNPSGRILMKVCKNNAGDSRTMDRGLERGEKKQEFNVGFGTELLSKAGLAEEIS